MSADVLFPLAADDVATTTDDWYTPRWIFDAIGFTFDLDVAAPVLVDSRTVPARRHLTILDDGLATPWEGTVWCNPPYSKATPWADKWAAHEDGIIVLPTVKSKWLGTILANADAFTLLGIDFVKPGRGRASTCPWLSIFAARGARCAEAVARVAAADRFARGGYLRGAA